MAEYNQRLEDLLDHHLIDNEELEKKQKLGGIGYTINGNMCLGIYNDLLVARVGTQLAEILTEKKGVSPYLPKDDDFDEFISVEDTIYTHSKALQKFIDESISYTRQLPPKEHDQDELDLSDYPDSDI